MTKLESVRKHGITAQGRRELMNYLKGKDLAMREAILARCYDCMSYYADGISDCRTTECPLYVFMPYRKARRKKKAGTKKPAANKSAKKAAAAKKPAVKKSAVKKQAGETAAAKKPAKKAVKEKTARKPKKKVAAKAAPAVQKNGNRKNGKQMPESLPLFKM